MAGNRVQCWETGRPHDVTFSCNPCNQISVDSGQTAQYVYDAFNRRVWVHTNGNSAEQEPVYQEIDYDLNGKRLSIWDGSSGNLQKVQLYWGSKPVAFYKGSAIHFQHGDWLGSERVTTGYNGAAESNIGHYPFGEVKSSSGNLIDAYQFGQLDHTDANTEHAQFREYENGQGHWLAPDPYDGSYNPYNPQSFNRYSYTSNNPIAAVDPSGMDDCIFGCNDGPDTGFPPFFGGAPRLGKFHDRLGSRPTAPGDDDPLQATGDSDWTNPLSEHLGLPPGAGTGTTLNDEILGALGLPSGGCEFGACGGGFGYTEGRGDSPPLISVSMGVDAVWGGLLGVAKVAGCAIVGAGKGLQSSLYKRPQLNTPPGEGSLARLGYGAYKTGAPALMYRLSQGRPFSRLAGDFVPYVGQGILLIQGGIALNDASQVSHECASKVIQ